MAIAVTEWVAANDKFRWNVNPTTKLSTAAGFMGADFGGSFDLGGGRTAMFAGDTNIATAAGQRPIFGNETGSTAAPATKAVRNAIVIVDNYDPSLASNPQAYYSTDPDGEPQAFFRDLAIDGQPYFRFPSGGIVLDGRLFIIGSATINTPGSGIGFATQGMWACVIDNIAGTPDQWIVTELEYPRSVDSNFFPYLGTPSDEGDGYIYVGGGSNIGSMMGRWPRADFVAGRLQNPEHFDGVHWTTDQPQAPRVAYIPRRDRTAYTPIDAFHGAQLSPLVKRSDGLYQYAAIPYAPLANINPKLAVVTWPQSQGPWGPITEPTEFYTPQAITDDPSRIIYSPVVHPQMTWAGKPAGAGAQVWSHSVNGGGTNPLYFPRFYQITGL